MGKHLIQRMTKRYIYISILLSIISSCNISKQSTELENNTSKTRFGRIMFYNTENLFYPTNDTIVNDDDFVPDGVGCVIGGGWLVAYLLSPPTFDCRPRGRSNIVPSFKKRGMCGYGSETLPVGWSKRDASTSVFFYPCPIGVEIFIGHGFGVMFWFSFDCSFW